MLPPGHHTIIDPPASAELRAYAFGLSARACVNGLGLLLTIAQHEAACLEPLQVIFHTEAFTEAGTVAYGSVSLPQLSEEATPARLCMDGARALGCLVVDRCED